jgi:hypothetical protein
MGQRRKHMLQSAITQDIQPPAANQQIVRALGTRGGNIVEVRGTIVIRAFGVLFVYTGSVVSRLSPQGIIAEQQQHQHQPQHSRNTKRNCKGHRVQPVAIEQQ